MLVDFTEEEQIALEQSMAGETVTDSEALQSARAKLILPEELPEETFSDEYGQQDGETIPGGGYDVEIVVQGSTEPDPVSPEETI